MNNYIKAALASIVCVLTAAPAIQAQLPAQVAKRALGGVSSSYGNIATGALSRKVAGFTGVPSSAINVAGRTSQASAKAAAIYGQYNVVRVNQAKLKASVEKMQISKQKRDRATLVANVLLNREALVRGYNLPRDFIEGFYFKRIERYMQKPDYTADKKSDTVLFRGMLVTPEELAKILQVGFSPKTSSWNAGTNGNPAVSLSSSSVEASHYIFQSGVKKDGIGVVFEVRRKPYMVLGTDPVLNRNKTIYYSYQDIPAEEIVGVSVWGEYGLERLSTILEKAKNGEIKSNRGWTGQFGNVFR